MKIDKKILDEELLVKFLMGECSEDEISEVNAYLNESDENVRELFRLEELYQLGRRKKISEEELDKVEKRLFDAIRLRERNRKKNFRMYGVVRYAAIFVGVFILAGLSYVTFQQYWQEGELIAIITQDDMKEVTLSDGTKVWLNKYTQLKYPKDFKADYRKVYLEGEGYFEVAKNEKKPFVVQSEAMQVRVLGTVFNLKSDKNKMSAVATLVHGEIEVRGNHDEGMIILSPGQKAELDGVAKRLVVKQVETGIENWYDNSFIFDKSSIFTIVRTLESVYNVKIILSPEIDAQKTYTGVLMKKESIDKSLDLIKNVISIDYKVVGNKVYLFSSNEE